MRTFSKHFDTLKMAEAYQNRLMDRYDHVRLVRSPVFGQSGTYVWEVK